MAIHPLAILPILLGMAGARPGGARLTVTSPAFPAGGAIPKRHTCDGGNVSPAVAWSGAPAATKSFAVVVDDPDARNFTHWLIFDIPASATSMPEGVRAGSVPKGAAEAANDFGATGYGGPCPPSGTHRYSHRVYALDVASLALPRARKKAFEAAAKGHVLAEGELVGTYRRAGR